MENTTQLQVDPSLFLHKYNILLATSPCQEVIQGNISPHTNLQLVDRLFPPPNPKSEVGPSNQQENNMGLQLLLSLE